MRKINSKKWYIFLIKGIILIVLSFLVLVNPEGTLKAIALYIGVGFFISGIVLAIRGIPAMKSDEKINWNLIEGVIDLIFGFLFFLAPLVMVNIIPVLLGLWAVVYGILVLIDAFNNAINRSLKFITGTVILLLAFILLFKPLLFSLTVTIWLGILLLIAGVLNVTLAIKLKEYLDKSPDTLRSE
jgi:uncharacterized membrane protein HdeD (DUF308 family)